MSVESVNLGRSTAVLNGLNNHNSSPGKVLKLHEEWEGIKRERDFIREHLPPHKLVEEDGSIFLPLDEAGRGLLAEIPPGGIVGMALHRKGLEALDPHDFIVTEAIAIVIHNSPLATELLALMKRVLNSEGKEVPAEWALERGPTGYSEKDLARAALTRMYSPTAGGIEGSQMSSVFDITTNGLPQDRPIRAYGCYSHEKPIEATSQNVMRGSTRQEVIRITENQPNLYVRLRHGDNFPFNGLPLDSVIVDEGALMFQGLYATAQRVAATNPRNMGAGTDSNHVFEALVQASTGLPELAMNGASIQVARQEFIQRIK